MIVNIVQGLPGSGKSTWVRQHSKNYPEDRIAICSADDYFMKDGEYVFDPSKLGEAHAACFNRFWVAAESRLWPRATVQQVYVDNTNIRLHEMAPYVAVGKLFRYRIHFHLFDCSIEESVARNTHGVPEETIRRMAKSMEKPLPYWGEVFRHA